MSWLIDTHQTHIAKREHADWGDGKDVGQQHVYILNQGGIDGVKPVQERLSNGVDKSIFSLSISAVMW